VISEPTKGSTERRRPDQEQDRHLVLEAIGRRPWVVVAFVVLTAAAAYLFSGLQQEKYSASSSLLFGGPGVAAQILPNIASPPGNTDAEAETNVRLVLSRAVAERVAARLPGLTNDQLTTDQVQARISAAQEGRSNVVEITATDTDPDRAARLADRYAEEFVAFRRDTSQAEIRAARAGLADQIARLAGSDSTVQARKLRRRNDELATLEAVVTGNVQLLDRAEPPDAPSSPNKRRSALLGGLAGLLLGLGAALALEQIDRRVRRSSDIEEALGLPVLATIPRSLAIEKDLPGALLDPDGGLRVDMEPFRALRAKLPHLNIGREVRSVLVTSASPGEGRSTVSLGLAAAAAAAGDRVLLIEADWRRPALGPRLSDQGLSLLLDGAVKCLDDVIVKLPVASSSGGVRPSSRVSGRSLELDILPAGPVPANPGELLESPRMRHLIVGAQERYDLVVIDTPPISVVADAYALMGSVHGVLLVTRLHRSTRDAVGSLRDHLSDFSPLILGVVVNGADRPSPDHREYLRVGANGPVRRLRGFDNPLRAGRRDDS
jgi:polysaccharide biosynthesis transport protein